MAKYQQYKPKSKSLCLCGSGLIFRDCCKGRLPGSAKIGKEWRKWAADDQWLRAIKCLRADVTQYTIWHISHTARAVSIDPEVRQSRLMQIDISALSDHVGLLMMAYARYGLLHKAIEALDRLTLNIDDPRWTRKIAYHNGICALMSEDRGAAAKAIAAIGEVSASDDDVEILQIYLDLNGSKMGLTEKLAFIDQICSLTTSNVDKLQYLGAKSFELVLAHDEKGACDAFKKTIDFGRQLDDDQSLSFEAETWLCKALEGLGIITRDSVLLDEVVTRSEKMLSEQAELTDAGISMVYRGIADAQRYSGKFEEAKLSYSAAYLHENDEVLLTFQAECALRQGNQDEAFRLIRSVNFENLGNAEKSDYAFISSFVAQSAGDMNFLKKSQRYLDRLVDLHPYFESQRLRHIVSIQKTIDAITNDLDLPSPVKRRSWLASISRYVLLQPNIAGIGINLNNMIEDAAARSDAKSKDSKND